MKEVNGLATQPNFNKIVIGVDTGTTQTAMVALQGRSVLEHMIAPNEDATHELIRLTTLKRQADTLLAIEMFEGRGQIAGQSSYDSIFLAGWLARAWVGCNMSAPVLIYRREVKRSLCGNSAVNDANIRRAILDEFEPLGGGAVPQVGIKKQPGPLYGIAKDKWSALAICITAQRGEYGKCRIKPQTMTAYSQRIHDQLSLESATAKEPELNFKKSPAIKGGGVKAGL